MTREQMLAWLAIEGWQLVKCRNGNPAFLKGICCVFASSAYPRTIFGQPYKPTYNLQWLVDTGTNKVHPCDATAYPADYLTKVIALIEKEGL